MNIIVVMVLYTLLLMGLLVYKIECDEYINRLQAEYKELLNEMKTASEEIDTLHKENEKLLLENKNLKIRERANLFN